MSGEIETIDTDIETTVEAQLPGMLLEGYAALRGGNMLRIRRVLTDKGHDVSGLSDSDVIALSNSLDRPFFGDGQWHLDHLPLECIPSELRSDIERGLEIGKGITKAIKHGRKSETCLEGVASATETSPRTDDTRGEDGKGSDNPGGSTGETAQLPE